MDVSQIDPLYFIGALVSVVAILIVFIIVSFHQKKVKLLNSNAKLVSVDVEPVLTPVVEDTSNTAPARTVKKSISFNTVYNLEEFMVRLYKVGFLVRRLKNGGEEKERFITIDQKGRIRFHKVLESKQKNQQPVRCHKPYFSFPISTLRECFACDDSDVPSFIMDFQGKTLHLLVATTLDRDYIVKGMNLVVQRAKNNANFLLRSSSLLQDGPAVSESPMRMETEEYEYDEDDASQISATTMNTTSRSYYNNSSRI
uniref:Uncharacterized protein n=1 Tax=Spumella elongata TaxID=89044 RepID=A0A7S3GR87_9STRA